MLTVRGLSRRFGERVLFTVDAQTSGWLWVRGPSGVGKSQLLRSVAGLVPHEGEVRLDDTPRGAPPEWRSRVTYVAQTPPAAEGTGQDWVQRVASLASQSARPADDPVAQAARWGLPAERWQRPLAELSGGERQRLWLALVLSRRPRVLLLDEPTSALDAETRDAVAADLRGRCGLLVTHDPALGEALADNVLELA